MRRRSTASSASAAGVQLTRQMSCCTRSCRLVWRDPGHHASIGSNCSSFPGCTVQQCADVRPLPLAAGTMWQALRPSRQTAQQRQAVINRVANVLQGMPDFQRSHYR